MKILPGGCNQLDLIIIGLLVLAIPWLIFGVVKLVEWLV